MAYATKIDIDKFYGERLLEVIADRDANGEVDVASVDRVLEDSTGEIEAYLSNRYNLPLDPGPPLIRRICVDIAVYHLAGMTGATMTNEIKDRYERALSFLKDIALGRASLGTNPGGEGGSQIQTPTLNVFGESVRA